MLNDTFLYDSLAYSSPYPLCHDKMEYLPPESQYISMVISVFSDWNHSSILR